MLKKGVHGLPSKVAVESGVSLSFFLAQISQYSLLQRLTRVNQKTSEVIQHKNPAKIRKKITNLLCIKHQQLLKRCFKLREQFQAKTHVVQNFKMSSTNYEVLFYF